MIKVKVNPNNKKRTNIREATRDAKVLRNLNVDHIKKKVPQNADEEIRAYFARINQLERDPPNEETEALMVFPKALVDWVESLPDDHFPTNGRKRFAKWLGNAIYFEETDGDYAPDWKVAFSDLGKYANECRYLADYLNGADETPDNLWELTFTQMIEQAQEWHRTLKDQESTGDYEFKTVVHKFDNGYTIVDVDTENDLEVEGNKMGHCVGGYCDRVAEGDAIIYSLRDAKNRPHATIEVLRNGHVQQIKGKGNDSPVEKYRGMILQWLKTTEFEYESSSDYLNLLTTEELLTSLKQGALPESRESQLAVTSQDPEIINFFLKQLANQQKIINMNDSGILRSIIRNVYLSEEQKFIAIKKNLSLEEPVLGEQIGTLLRERGTGGAGGSGKNNLADRLWYSWGPSNKLKTMGEFLKEGVANEEKIYCMKAIMYHGKNQAVKEEILDHLTSDRYLANFTEGNERLAERFSLPYGAVLQKYLFSKAPDPKQVERLYALRQDPRLEKLLGQSGRLDGYISSSRAMSDDLVDIIIKDVKNNLPKAMNQRNWLDLIDNPNISDSRRIQLLNVGKNEEIRLDRSITGMTRSHENGLRWYYSGKTYSQRFVKESKEGKHSAKFVKYMIDSGIFDPHYVRRWAEGVSKRTGKYPSLEDITGDEKHKALANARAYALKDFENGMFEQKTGEPWPPWLQEEKDMSMRELQENINIYLGSKKRPFGNIEDIDPEDLQKIKEWINDLRESGISDQDVGGIEVGL